MNVYEAVAALTDYALREKLIEKEDRVHTRNRLLETLSLDGFEERGAPKERSLEKILAALLGFACEKGLCGDSTADRDLFDTKLMGLLTPRPSEVVRKFRDEYRKSPEAATKFYYDFCRRTNYIRTDRIRKDVKWKVQTQYGELDITINLSKPEKDPKAIAAALKTRGSGYPLCRLCRENEGYAGGPGSPAKQNLRLIPVTIGGSEWFFQYSPYVYYNEHCIVLSSEHRPMKIDGSVFGKLFDFIRLFPHYFIGSNADLPIVGGSILTHEHFQGGNYEFAMARATVETGLRFQGFGDVEAGILKWPMSVLRLRSADADRLCALGARILDKWRGYTDERAFIFAETGGIPHNTVTPIARRRGDMFELDLVLRNNLTTEKYPDGLYHPHPEYHHIKKENIGLIEVMGLAVLPSRLKTELSLLEKAMVEGTDISADGRIAKHKVWADGIAAKYTVTRENCAGLLRKEVGAAFAAILEQCGVFARSGEGRARFLKFAASV